MCARYGLLALGSMSHASPSHTIGDEKLEMKFCRLKISRVWNWLGSASDLHLVKIWKVELIYRAVLVDKQAPAT